MVRHPPVGRSDPSGGQQGLFDDDQIGQGVEHLLLGAVLLEPLVTQFAMVKAVLDEVEDVLDPAADLGLEPLDVLEQGFGLSLGQGGDLAALGRDVPLHVLVIELLALYPTGIAGIGTYGFLLTMQQVALRGDIRHVDGHGGGAVHPPGFRIDPDVGLGAKVKLLALAGVIPVGIAWPRLVLGRGRCRDEGGSPTKVPWFINRPRSRHSALMVSKRVLVRPVVSSRWRNLSSVVASGTASRPRSRPRKPRNAWLS